MGEDTQRELAIKQLKAERAFKTSLVTYVVVNAFMVAIWALGDRGSFWPIWIILGWGIGLVLHAWRTYGQKPITEAAIREEMKKTDGDTEA